MRLMILVPAFNEEDVLMKTLAELPEEVHPFTRVDILVIDDGSTDVTAKIAADAGVRVISMGSHQGLARVFSRGLEEAIRIGADCVINFDADGQYRPEDIERLTRPIVEGRADMVLGDRGVGSNPNFSRVKRLFQVLGSRVVRMVSGIEVADATTGFRAFSREAAMKLVVFSSYTYTLETLIQAGVHGIRTMSVAVETRPPTRPSRLFRSVASYMARAGMTILRVAILYRPLRLFAAAAALFTAAGMTLFIRFLYYYVTGSGHGHVQSLILGAVLVITGIQLGFIGILSDLTSINRRLLEQIRWHTILLGYPPSGRSGESDDGDSAGGDSPDVPHHR